MIKLVIAVLVMVIGYGAAIVLIVRAFVVAASLRRDVPWVPSKGSHVREGTVMLELKEGDRVVDLGSGNGKFVLYASKLHPGVKFTGIEINWLLVNWSKFKAWLQRRKNVRFVQGDVFKQDYSGFNKVYLFMTRTFTNSLMPKLTAELPENSIVVASCFGFGDDFEKNNEFEEKYLKTGFKYDKLSIWRK